MNAISSLGPSPPFWCGIKSRWMLKTQISNISWVVFSITMRQQIPQRAMQLNYHTIVRNSPNWGHIFEIGCVPSAFEAAMTSGLPLLKRFRWVQLSSFRGHLKSFGSSFAAEAGNQESIGPHLLPLASENDNSIDPIFRQLTGLQNRLNNC